MIRTSSMTVIVANVHGMAKSGVLLHAKVPPDRYMIVGVKPP